MEWISAKEQLPVTEERVLCQTVTKKGAINMIVGYFADGRWCCGMNSNVVAWAKLPEPYEEREERYIAESEIYKVFSEIAKLPRHVIEDVLMFAATADATEVLCSFDKCQHCFDGKCRLKKLDMDQNIALGGCIEFKEINDE